MQRNTDFVKHSGFFLQQVPARRQQRAVGGDAHAKAFGGGAVQNLPQLRVGQRFTHDMEVKKAHMPLQGPGNGFKFRRAHLPGRPGRLRAEAAAEIALIGNFDVGFIQHETAAPSPPRAAMAVWGMTSMLFPSISCIK